MCRVEASAVEAEADGAYQVEFFDDLVYYFDGKVDECNRNTVL